MDANAGVNSDHSRHFPTASIPNRLSVAGESRGDHRPASEARTIQGLRHDVSPMQYCTVVNHDHVVRHNVVL